MVSILLALLFSLFPHLSAAFQSIPPILAHRRDRSRHPEARSERRAAMLARVTAREQLACAG